MVLSDTIVENRDPNSLPSNMNQSIYMESLEGFLQGNREGTQNNVGNDAWIAFVWFRSKPQEGTKVPKLVADLFFSQILFY